MPILSPSLRYRFLLCISCTVLFVTSASVECQAQFKDAIGWTQLQAEFGGSLADGASVKASIVEAPNGSGFYFPDTSSAQFTGKTFWNESPGTTDANSHATHVARNLAGISSGLATGISDITVFEANDWIDRVVGFDLGGDPLAQVNGNGEAFQVQSHSYIGSGLSNAEATEILQRIDFMVNRDNMTIVVGTNNGAGNTTPQLLAPGYNTITVGVTDGSHARGATTFYGAGRYKPEIVAPDAFTSFSTPVVASSAAILRDAGAGTNAEQNEVVKALLLGGATKDEFANWSRTTTTPMDTVYGSGELNIYNSYKMLLGGETDGSSSEPIVDAGLQGWDYFSNFDNDAELFYDFNVANAIDELSIALTWNIDITDTDAATDAFAPVANLEDLNLEFYDSSGSFLGLLLDSSVSAVDNIEYLYLTNLDSGRYTLRVTHDGGSVMQDFGLAWNISAIPEPATGIFLLAIASGMGFVRRRRKG